MDVYIGFDSAWTDNAPGAIAALAFRDGLIEGFHPPRLVTFAGALEFIHQVRSPDGMTLIALDQPTIVPNETSMRPVERAAASLVSWLGGGVQPSNRSKLGMFCPASPIWGFLQRLGASEDPEAARTAKEGLHIIEVFPALALPSIDEAFFGRLAAPRYNPERRKTFQHTDWRRVAKAAATSFDGLGLTQAAQWCHEAEQISVPRKADQDKLDAMLCLQIALRWRMADRCETLMLGCLENGYMVLPATAPVREKLTLAARKCRVAVDGAVPL